MLADYFDINQRFSVGRISFPRRRLAIPGNIFRLLQLRGRRQGMDAAGHYTLVGTQTRTI